MAGSSATVGTVAIVALLVGGCGDDSGQTGSMSCAMPTSAGCAMLTDRVIVEVEALEVDLVAEKGTFEVVASVNPSPSFNQDDEGMKLVGPYAFFALQHAHERANDPTLLESPPISIGDHLIATFSESDYRETHCAEYRDCAAGCKSTIYDDVGKLHAQIDACRDECAATCVPTRSDETWAELWVMPVAETYDFDGEILSLEDLRTLSVASNCFEVFPVPETPCDDTLGGP